MPAIICVPEPALPLPAPVDYSTWPIVDRMCEVIRRQSRRAQPTTRTDFHEAEETCDLTDADLDQNIGRAKRQMNLELVRREDHPRIPLAPWDTDADYKAERVELAARILVDRGITGRDGADLLAVLRQDGRFTAREIDALREPILTRATTLLLTRKFAEA